MKNNITKNVQECKMKSSLRHKLENWKLTGMNLVYALGCIIMIVASFLPYVSSDEKKLSLMDGYDGIFFLMLAVLIFIFIVYEKKKAVGILGIVLTYLGVYELIHTFQVAGKTALGISLQLGYFVLFAGTLVILSASGYYVYNNGLDKVITRIFCRRHAS